MKNLKQYIKEEILRLSEREYNTPPEILDTLKNRLELDPLVRYISHFKSINSVPPSYRAFLHNGEYFDIVYEDFSLMIEIGSKKYYLNDIDEKNYAIQHINRLLTGPRMRPEPVDDEDEEGGDKGGSLPPLPPAPKGAGPKPPTPPEPEPTPEDEE